MGKRRHWLAGDLRRYGANYLLALPAVVYVFIFGYATLPFMVIAFKRFNFALGVFDSPFVGLENFRMFFASNKFPQVTFNTLGLNAMFITCTMVVSLSLSILLSERMRKGYRRIVQTMYLMPTFISWVVVSYIVYALLGTDLGFINKTLVWLGLPKVGWYNTPAYWKAILVVIKLWKDAGMSGIIYLAAIAGIDPSIYESATMDGANRGQNIWYITLPCLMPTICIMMLLSIGKIFYGDFGMVYSIVRDNAVLFPATDVIDVYVYRLLRKSGDMSQAMAAGMYQAVLGFVMIWCTNLIVRKAYPDGSLF